MRRNIVTSVFMFIILFYLSGCSLLPKPTTQEVIIKGIENNKSIIIIPKPNVYNIQTSWSKIGDKKDSKWSYITRKSYFLDGFSLSKDYVAVSIDAGIYYIWETRIRDKIYEERKITNNEKYNSTIGIARFERTPLMRKKRKTESADKPKNIRIDSYYKTYYTLADTNIIDIPQMIGYIKIGQGEIILMPNVWVDIVLAENSCKFANEWLNNFWFQVIYDIGNRFHDEFDTLEWLCPIKSIIINVKKGSIDDFVTQINQKDFPEKLLERIVVRNFEFGEMFKNAKKMESLEDGIERYIIDGSADK